ncbi:hypothetical protein GCM10023226_05620 [Nocardioides nanhaiensis]|uniref:Uncharacterized protein n=1 Tax=Nocardioides nanhaiensis TaxID=1476871 RepID=A0ABP8VVG3_9ACTN
MPPEAPAAATIATATTSQAANVRHGWAAVLRPSKVRKRVMAEGPHRSCGRACGQGRAAPHPVPGRERRGGAAREGQAQAWAELIRCAPMTVSICSFSWLSVPGSAV